MSDTRILYGFHALTGRLRRAAHSVHEIYVDAARHDARARELIARAHAAGVRVVEADAARIDALAGTRKHQGVVARVREVQADVSLDEILAGAEAPLLLVLDGVQDPHNLGACLRVADAFGAQAVIAPKDRAVGMTPAVAKVASGAAETVPYVQVTNLARALRQMREAGVWIMGADGAARDSIFDAPLDGALAWVLGAEAEGLRRLTREGCDRLLRIPMQGSVDSLNVSVAAGICLYESRRQRAPVPPLQLSARAKQV
ncbi:MAG: 23S rRNA (guanosine(2251)-2'-O)-methyltransferase RlmB [Burkholderiales bacterium]|nr:23S rRNA (guanosine(2251)-2'-O)-methyltransferase RlmB [Burkholderiales bacterium]